MKTTYNKQAMLFEAKFSKEIRKDGFVYSSSDGRAYVIASDFEDATSKSLKAFTVWKNEDKGRNEHVLESITLIDDSPVF